MLQGDILLIYTDGLIDQENSKGDYFGEKRLISFLKKNIESNADEIIDRLYDTERIFGTGTNMDDMTAVIIKRNR